MREESSTFDELNTGAFSDRVCLVTSPTSSSIKDDTTRPSAKVVHSVVAEMVFIDTNKLVAPPDAQMHRYEKLWRERVSALLLDTYKIDEQATGLMGSWCHSGFSMVTLCEASCSISSLVQLSFNCSTMLFFKLKAISPETPAILFECFCPSWSGNKRNVNCLNHST